MWKGLNGHSVMQKSFHFMDPLRHSLLPKKYLVFCETQNVVLTKKGFWQRIRIVKYIKCLQYFPVPHSCDCLNPRPGGSTWLQELMNGLLIDLA